MLEMLLFVAFAIAIVAADRVVIKHSARADARRRNQAHPWK